MSPWKSRWSSVRFVNTAASKCSAVVRSWAIAIEDASMTTWPMPALRISESSRCTSGASGVVSGAGSACPPKRYAIVPITPVVHPAARQMPSRR
jgi:hypothetical protein